MVGAPSTGARANPGLVVWGPKKEIGFALAALLADDRELGAVGGTLLPAQRDALSALLVLDGDKGAVVRRWLSVLKPSLDPRSLHLPARMRTALARLAPSTLRKQLLLGALGTRSTYAADEALLALLLRVARNPGTRASS